MEELISIIIPVYNSEKYISKCLKSLIKQKYNNWEAIIVNDGSSDKSQDIIENFVKKDSRFKSYYQKNSGVSSARNFGLKKVTGSYITFLDSDDEYKEDYLSKMLGSMHDNGTQLVICGFERYDLESKKTFFTTKLESQHISKSELFKKFWKYYENEVINSNCNKLYRSDISHNYNILFNSSMKIGEDLNFNLDYLAHTEYVGIVGESLFIYNKHGSQATNKGYEKRFQDVIIYFENIKVALKVQILLMKRNMHYIFRKKLLCQFQIL